MPKCKVPPPEYFEKLSQLLSARVPLRTALLTLAQEPLSPFNKIVHKRVSGRELLSEAVGFALTGKANSNHPLVEVIRAGEEHGRVEDALIDAARYLRSFNPKPIAKVGIPPGLGSAPMSIVTAHISAMALLQALQVRGLKIRYCPDHKSILDYSDESTHGMISGQLCNQVLCATMRQGLLSQAFILVVPMRADQEQRGTKWLKEQIDSDLWALAEIYQNSHFS